jgi:N,N'-diacetyllegionaminate synthase
MWSEKNMMKAHSGREHSCLVIAEIGQAHDGSLGAAHAYIDAAAGAGADAVKFQTHIAAAESSPAEPWRIRFSQQDVTRYEYWRRMEFTEEQWAGLARHASDKNLYFLSSPFSIEAADMLLRTGIDGWKIASGEVNNQLLLNRIASTGLPVLLSTGMSPVEEIDNSVALLQARGVALTVLQCTSAYPCPPEKTGLNMLDIFRSRYGCAVGLSDHSGTIYAGLAAAALGADALEVHITFSRECFGPDVPASITISELHQLVDGVRFIERMRTNPVNKNMTATELEPMRALFTKSVVVRTELPADTVLREEHLTVRKPGSGIPAHQLGQLVGRKLQRPVTAGHFLLAEDLAEDLAEVVPAA